MSFKAHTEITLLLNVYMNWLQVCQPLDPRLLFKSQVIMETYYKKTQFCVVLTRKAFKIGGQFLVFSDKLYHLTFSDTRNILAFS